MYCKNCGKELVENMVFCDECGAKQDVDEVKSLYNAEPSRGKAVNIFVIIAGIILALGTIIPCYSISFMGVSESMSYIEGDGVFVLIAAIVVIVLAIFKKEKFACIPAIFSIILLITMSSELSKVGFGSYGVGAYLMWIGSVASCVLPFVKLR